ncbi:MAG: hypothetical protein JSS66_01725 [Armatimonadetes bacterium]|nr:hypothetical protein [Armatimonadota bacterium]
MSWRQKATLGQEFVADVHDLLRVDETYVLDTGDGFIYWAGDLSTKVTTDIGVFRQSTSVYRVTAETEFIKGRGHIADVAMALETEMDSCSFSGPVYDQATDTFRLFCGVYATSEQAHWLRRTMAAAVALQIAEAHELAKRFSVKFNTTQATSGHPNAGIRPIPDPVLQNAVGFFHPSGDQPSSWEGVPAWEQAGWIMEREARRFESDRQTHLTAVFDWVCGGDEGMVLQIRTDDPHPKLGNGLHVTLTVPMRLNAVAIGHLALDLNTYEKTEYKRCHTLGSWCMHDGKLAFREFVPNALYDPEYLEELCVNMSTRAIWANEWFYEMKCKAEAERAGSA